MVDRIDSRGQSLAMVAEVFDQIGSGLSVSGLDGGEMRFAMLEVEHIVCRLTRPDFARMSAKAFR